MDPISTAVLAAIVAGATAGLTDAAKLAIGDAYAALKDKIEEKYGQDSDLTAAVTSLEAKPASEGRKATLQEEVKTAKADQDKALLALARALNQTIDKQARLPGGAMVDGRGVIVEGSNNRVVGAGGVMVGGNVGGDVVTGKKSNQKAGEAAVDPGRAGDVKTGRR